MNIIFLKNDEVATVLSLLSVNKELLNSKRWLTLVKLRNDPDKADSNFFCYAATVLSRHRNVLIFTQRMHKPT